jgi:hypothetical protein
MYVQLSDPDVGSSSWASIAGPVIYAIEWSEEVYTRVGVCDALVFVAHI